MTPAPFEVALLNASHGRSRFDCGTPALNRYLAEQASQDMRRRVASCFLAHSDDGRIAGYYTLAAASVPLAEPPAAVTKKLPRYRALPTVRMGRLAVDLGFKRQGLGGALLADALTRCKRSEIAAYALLVDAKDEQASAFYQHHGFILLSDAALTLFLPLASVPAQT
ncbi:GNAT family N-acetyltransferase [Roseateles sp. DC23W]|uniref:GNAT family N-acetyltransferase n=1 Tax=Pelomonas dachongensis TaxID=3299029 RepID=A0ABW7ER43_9BURK